MASLREQVANLAPKQRAILELRLRRKRLQRENRQAVVQRRWESESFPLSLAQQRLWVVHQLDPRSAAHNVHGGVRLRGALRVRVLESCLREIVRRHDSLRTTFAIEGGQDVQRIGPVPSVVLRWVDLSGLPGQASAETVWELAAEESRRPFDLETGPPFRFILLCRAPGDHVLLVTQHHIVSDRWSIELFLREMGILYEAFSANRPSPLPELRYRYVDFARWQQEHLRGEVLERGLAFWRERLGGELPVLRWPSGRAPAPGRTHWGAIRERRLPEALSRELQALSRRHGVTLFMTLLALFKALLFHFTRQDDLIVGTSIANRNRPEFDGIIGFFINLLVLRTDLSGNPTFLDLLARVRETTLAAFAHSQIPFDKLVEELQPERHQSSFPIAQVGFELAHTQESALVLPGVELAPVESAERPVRSDLLLMAESKSEAGLNLTLEYCTDVFGEEEIDGLLEHFEELAGHMTRDPDTPVKLIPLFRKEMAAALGIPVSRMGRIAPLTPTQRDLYLAHLLDPQRNTYVEAGSVDLGPDLDPEAWRQAVKLVASGDEMLRTRLFSFRGEVFQFVDTRPSVSYELLDLNAAGSGMATVEDVVARVAKQRGEIHMGDLVRNLLVRDRSGNYVSIVGCHHVVLDGYSMKIYWERIGATYEALVGGGLAKVSAAGSFFDHIGESLARQDSRAVREYWSERLRRVVPLQELPALADKPRPATRTYLLNAAKTAALAELCRKSGCRLPAMLLAAYGALLHRVYDPPGDFVVYNFISGRSEGYYDSLGCFYQVIPVVFPRSLCARNRPVAELLGHVGRYRKDIGPMQDVSILMQKRLIGNEGLKFYYNYYRIVCAELLGQGRVLEDYNSFSVNEVHLIVSEIGEELELKLHYGANVFIDGAFLERFVSFVGELASGAARWRDPDVLLQSERHQVLVGWNDSAHELPLERPFTELFEARARRTPEATAVIAGDLQVSYRELDRRSRALALRLASEGVGPEVVVTLLAPRGVEFLTGMLAVFQAGGAYLPLDPRHPGARWSQILEQASSPLALVTEELLPALAGALEPLAERQRPRVLTLTATEAARAVRDLPRRSSPELLAYVIFTSGSTGIPKGAMVHQRGMVNHLFAKISSLPLGRRDVVAQTASQSFDISVWQFLAALAVGGRVEIFADAVAFDASRLLAEVERRGVTVLETVPSLLQAVLDDETSGGASAPELSRLRWLIPTGEALSPPLCRSWLEHYPRIPVLNAYGPTECSDDVSHHARRSPPAAAEVRMPIGRPVSNLLLYVLDRRLQPVPPGVSGELHAGGVGVGRGYLHDPRQTAAVFVPDPFGRRPGERLYKTGDLVRYRGDGNLEFLARIDHQVKVRGFRIELGEIESVLAEHPDLRANVVAVRDDHPDVKQLTAYVVPRHGAEVSVAVLAGFLAERLPDHMVPAAWMTLDALPLTANGKVDRKALPVPDVSHSDADYLAPRNATEKLLADIWSEVLGVGRVGVHDNFFRLGGDSILSIRVSTKATRAGIKLTPRDVFLHPTLAELAPMARTAAPAGTAEQGPVTGPVPLSPMQRWFLESAACELDHWNQSSMFTPRRALDPGLLRTAAGHLLEHHDALRARFYRDPEGVWRQESPGRHPGGFFCHCDLSALPRGERRPVLEAAAARCQASLDLERGDLVRVVLFHLGPEDAGRVLLIFHHLVVDGVSWRILLEDLQTAYEALESGRTVRLPAKTTPFQHWSRRLEELASTPAVEAEASYWLSAADDGAEVLPTGGPVRGLRVSLTRTETRAVLRELPAACGADVNAVLLSALASAAGPIRLDLESHGREEAVAGADLTRTVGFFTSAFPVVLELPSTVAAEDRPRVVLSQVQRIPRQGLGYGLLHFVSPKKEVRRRMASLPRSRLLFNYLGQLDSAFSPAALLHPAGESVGPESARRERSHPLEISVHVRREQMRFDWTWCEDAYRQEDVERLAHACLEELRTLMERTRRSAAPEESASARVVSLQPLGKRPPIFCVHPADGKVLCYLDLVRHMHADQPFYGVECSSVNGNRDVSMAGLGARYAEVIRAAQPQGPYFLGGISFGGLVAFELAQHLVRAGQEVALLALFDAWSPLYQGKASLEFDPVTDLGADLIGTARTWVQIHGGRLALDVESLRGMDPGEQLDHVMNEIAKTGAVSTGGALAKVRQALAINQKHFLALTRYRATQVYPGRITLFRARELAAIDTLRRHAAQDDPAHGWGELSAEPIELHEIPGDHQTMMLEPHVRILAAKLQACLDRAAGLISAKVERQRSRKKT